MDTSQPGSTPAPPPPGRSAWLAVAAKADARGDTASAERYRQLAMKHPEGT